MGDTVAVFTQALFACLLASGWQATECPAASAIAAELQRLGTAAAVAGFGSPEVTVQGSRMRVALRAPDGTVSGVREVAAPASCLERAQVAAVLISAWIGAWHAGPFPDAARPPSSSTEGGGDAPPVSPTSSALPPAPATGAPTPLPSAARDP